MPDLERAAESQPKKSNTAKILLGCAGVVIVLVTIAGIVGYNFVQGLVDPAEIKKTWQTVTGTEVPEGFTPQTHLDLIFQYAVVQNEENGHLLVVGQIDKGQGPTLEQQLQTITDAMMPKTGSETLGSEEFAAGDNKLVFSKLRHDLKSGGKVIEFKGQLPPRGGKVRYLKYLGTESALDVDALKKFLGDLK